MAGSQDVAFGKNAVALGLLKPAQLAACLRFQEEERQQGRSRNLPELLVEKGYLDISQVTSVWDFYHKSSGASGKKGSNPPASRIGKADADKQPDASVKAAGKVRGEEQTFGRYKILEEVGRGGMGCVYKASDTELNRTVAIKMLLAEEPHLSLSQSQENVDVIERFTREAKAMAQLHHPNIVAVYDIGTEQGKHYFTMDFIEGESLQKLLKKSPPASREIAELMIAVCDGVHYAHRQGVIHRDLKPANIMLTADRQPKIMDFGLAKVSKDNKKLSHSGVIIGTLQYMPPEQANGQIREIDERSDIYSLGAMLYEMLTGRPPFSGGSFTEIIEQICCQEPLPPKRIKATIPRDLEKICLKALEKSKDKRYQSAASMMDDLIRFRRGENVQARPPGLGERILRKARKHKTWTIAAISAIMCLLFGGIGLGVWKQIAYWEQLKTLRGEIWQMQRELPGAQDLSQRYALQKNLMASLNQEARQAITQALQKCMQVRTRIEQALLLFPDSADFKIRLYHVEKEMGLLALLGRDYLLSQLCFERCKALGNPKEAEGLIQALTDKREEVQKTQLARIAEIMSELQEHPPEPGMLEEYATEILRMQGEHTVAAMLSYLNSPHTWQRVITIAVLGKLGDKHTKVNGKDTGEWLVDRLKSLDFSKQLQEAEELVWALGRLKDARASKLVNELRFRVGQDSNFWLRTHIPSNWIPLEAGEKLDNAVAWQERALRKINKGDVDGAIADLNEAIRMKPEEVGNYLNRGVAKQQKKDWDGALADFNKAAQLKPNLPQIYNNRGIIRQEKGDLVGALADFQESIRLNPKNLNTYTNLALLHIARGEIELAWGNLNKALELNPLYAPPYFYRGKIRHEKRELDAAIVEFTQAIALNPQHAEVYLWRGHSKARKNDIAGALADYTQAVRLDPKNIEYYRNRAVFYAQNGNWEGALADYSQILHISPKDIQGYLARGVTFRNKGEPDKALADLDHALTLDMKRGDAYLERGITFRIKGELEKALADFNQALLLDAKNIEAYSQRATVWGEKGDFAKTVADFESALSLNPKSMSIYFNFAVLHYKKGEYDAALAKLAKVLELNPRQPDAYKVRGVVRLYKSQLTPAIADFKKYLELQTNYDEVPSVYLMLMLTQKRTKDEQGFKATVASYQHLQRLTSWKGFTPKLLEYYSGTLTEDALFELTHQPKEEQESRLCEFYYYVGMSYLVKGNQAKAKEYLGNCLKHGSKGFIEPDLAQLELKK